MRPNTLQTVCVPALLILLSSVVGGCSFDHTRPAHTGSEIQLLRVPENGRYLQYENGTPVFWLGDTGWLLFHKLSREEASQYLQDRQHKGFNVIQVMVIHDLSQKNHYGDFAFVDEDPARPDITPGRSFDVMTGKIPGEESPGNDWVLVLDGH